MLAISTGGIGPMDVSQGRKSSGLSKEEEKAMEAFSSLMDMVSVKHDIKDYDDSGIEESRDISVDNSKKSDYDSYVKESYTSVNKYEDKSKVSSAQQEPEDKSIDSFDSASSEDAVGIAANVLKEVKENLTQKLGISDEELDNLLDNMGISLHELLSNGNLKNFVLQIQNAKEVDLLINEELAELFNSLSNEINEILGKYGITDVKDFGDFVVSNQKQIAEQLNSLEDTGKQHIADDKSLIKTGDNIVTNNKLETNDLEKDISGETDAIDNQMENINGKSNYSTSDLSENDEVSLNEKIFVKTGSESGYDGQESNSNMQIAGNLNQAIGNALGTDNIDAVAFVDAVQEADIIRQIIDQVKVTVSKDVKSMEVQLNPEQLGKVRINVVSEDGIMHTKIIAETEAAKQAIENNIDILKEAFNNNELKVESIEVMVASYGYFDQPKDGEFDENHKNSDMPNKGSIKLQNIDEDAELTESEKLEIEMMKSQGNSVSYLA